MFVPKDVRCIINHLLLLIGKNSRGVLQESRNFRHLHIVIVLSCSFCFRRVSDDGAESIKEDMKRPVSVSRCHSRCPFKQFQNFFNRLKPDAKPIIKAQIESTTFGFLLSCPSLKSDNVLLSALVAYWDKSREGFRIFGKFLPFRVEDQYHLLRAFLRVDERL